MNSNELLQIAKILENSSSEILAQFAKLPIEKAFSSTKPKNELFAIHDLSFAIGVTGAFNGFIVMNLNKKMAFFLAEAMTAKKQITELDDLSKSALGELSNIIVGQTLSKFAENGHIDITPPEFVLFGHNMKLFTTNDMICVTQLETKKGIIEFIISLKKRLT
jgi:chemotaxis protein CheX